MMIRAYKALVAIVAPILVLGLLLSSKRRRVAITVEQPADNPKPDNNARASQSLGPPNEGVANVDILAPSHLLTIDDDGQPVIDTSTYRILHSNSTATGTYFPIHLGGSAGFNPTIIPHPTKFDAWIVVVQQIPNKSPVGHSSQLICNAGFMNDVLICMAEPAVLPVKATRGNCEDELAHFNFEYGPRDARLFYGPVAPYLVYGSHSAYTCMGMWMQDFRMLVDDYRIETVLAKDFTEPTELQRPPPYKGVEKNFFVFWDTVGNIHAHTEIVPQRVFSRFAPDGFSGPNLAPMTVDNDERCMARYMPPTMLDTSAVQQATNSLAITLCMRSDPNCMSTDKNTFILALFHYKTNFDGHSVYEPYAMLFQRSEPFALHGISTKPFWISGRSKFSRLSGNVHWQDSDALPENHSEMFYIRSINWRAHGQKYHGYMDDILFLAFGIEQSRSGAIDVVAADLLQDLGLCSELK
ncbi:hypothetical protein ABEF95_012749 [Exophiala dermatitidis]